MEEKPFLEIKNPQKFTLAIPQVFRKSKIRIRLSIGFAPTPLVWFLSFISTPWAVALLFLTTSLYTSLFASCIGQVQSKSARLWPSLSGRLGLVVSGIVLSYRDYRSLARTVRIGVCGSARVACHKWAVLYRMGVVTVYVYAPIGLDVVTYTRIGE
jgi:hypothetical protein